MEKIMDSILSWVLIVGFFLLFNTPSSAQNLTGYWEGICKKHSNEYSFKAEAEIKQDKQSIEALLKIAYRDKSFFCIQEIKGNSEGNVFEFTAIRNIRQEHQEGFYWLLLRGVLSYDSKEDRLYGWVDAYDVHNQEVYKNHDFIELFRKINNL
jgi:hypothetical protein